MTTTKSLLVELFVEELPPKSLKKLGDSFAEVLAASLMAQGLVGTDAAVTAYASPRRLAVHVTGVAEQSADKLVSQKLMPVAVGLDVNGQATPALLKKLASIGADSSMVRRENDGKADMLILDKVEKSMSLTLCLIQALWNTLDRLPIAKWMTYQLADGWSSVQFVRPAHGLVALHGADIVPITILGLQSGRETQGHRFEADVNPVVLKDADNYAQQLETEGAVIASFAARRTEIAKQLAAAAAKEKLTPVVDDALLDEVTALVERPNVLVGKFEKEFLEVPQECLVLTMKANQKYFPLLDSKGKLTNKFLIVSNIRPADDSLVIVGNERVLRARLSDAKFFFEQDGKIRLEDRIPKLANVVYHNKLGSQLQRVERIQKLSVAIAARLKEIKFAADIKHVERAAYLCKADLLTDMVGEFPELQGIMGCYYALHDGEALQVAEAIREHYERVPESPAGICVGLAEKLDTLVGIYGIGLVPTGDKDPFGLRRAALSLLRTLMENSLSLNLMQLLEITEAQFPAGLIGKDTVSKLYDFMLERLKPYLREQDYRHDEIEAVLSLRPTRMDWIVPRLKAIQEFRKMPEAESLAAANKRIRNILKQAQREPMEIVNASLLKQDEEQHLAQHLALLEAEVMPLIHHEEYTQALKHLASLRPAVDAFFDKVMVMVEDKALRDNRLALLTKLEGLFMRVADISKLQYGVQQS